MPTPRSCNRFKWFRDRTWIPKTLALNLFSLKTAQRLPSTRRVSTVPKLPTIQGSSSIYARITARTPRGLVRRARRRQNLFRRRDRERRGVTKILSRSHTKSFWPRNNRGTARVSGDKTIFFSILERCLLLHSFIHSRIRRFCSTCFMVCGAA